MAENHRVFAVMMTTSGTMSQPVVLQQATTVRRSLAFMAFEPRAVLLLIPAARSCLVMYVPLGEQRKKSPVSSMLKINARSNPSSCSRISAIRSWYYL